MQNRHLEIKRSGQPTSFRWPAWLNILAVVSAIAMLLAISFLAVYQSDVQLADLMLARELDGEVASDSDRESVFASRWMPKIGTGLVTKMDRADAQAPISKIRSFVWTLVGLLLLTAVSTLFYRWYVCRLRMLAQQADLDRKRLGAYELDDKVGEGGMGVVYRAKHALMRRPTAIKILPPEKSSQAAVERFEREVQYTSQLKHPNTIAIYDYGRSENGLFYYAMELLDGLNLEQLVRSEGPLPDGRVIDILRQVCQSLREAHSLGLIHRDIKPENYDQAATWWRSANDFINRQATETRTDIRHAAFALDTTQAFVPSESPTNSSETKHRLVECEIA